MKEGGGGAPSGRDKTTSTRKQVALFNLSEAPCLLPHHQNQGNRGFDLGAEVRGV